MTSIAPKASAPKNVIYGLYCHCHPEAGIRYVGQTSEGAMARLYGHTSMTKYRIEHGMSLVHSQNWIQKHGYANIAIRVLEVCADAAALNEAEPKWIAEFHNLTNVQSGGFAARGHKRPAAANEKMRGVGNPSFGKDRSAVMAYARSFQGPVSAETRARLSAAKLGRTHSAETKALMSESAKTSWTPERRESFGATRAGESHPMYGRRWDEERKRATSLARTKLTIEQILEIKRLGTASGFTHQEISDLMGGAASKHVVGDIIRGEKFGWIVTAAAA